MCQEYDYRNFSRVGRKIQAFTSRRWKCLISLLPEMKNFRKMCHKLALALALMVMVMSIGLHLMGVQIVAWGQMLIERSQHSSLVETVETTFSGNAPCNLCEKVNEASHSELKQEEGSRRNSGLTVLRTEALAESRLDLIAPDRDVLLQFTGSHLMTMEIGYLLDTPPPRLS